MEIEYKGHKAEFGFKHDPNVFQESYNQVFGRAYLKSNLINLITPLTSFYLDELGVIHNINIRNFKNKVDEYMDVKSGT